MNIRFAESKDIGILVRYDRHISKEEIENSILRNFIYIAEDHGRFRGWLRYNLFWDSIPFMNMLYVLEEYRGRGVGRQIVTFWENEMSRRGHKMLMTSTRADELAQHFYFKIGYEAIGGFKLGDEPYEMIFSKNKG
ncbi:MAG: GNAT family N-acetyltransferase [Coprococcus sp.]|nr:GNAT family N-acetyltransferase [Coprococcus sp.]